MANPTRAYNDCLADCRRHHESSKTFSGKLLRPHAPFIKEMIDRLGCKSVLDYGCGKGEQYRWISHGGTASIPGGMTIEEYWGVQVIKYDPAYGPYAAKPEGQFDLVVCTHTLGSIPMKDLKWVINEIYAYARKGIYVAEKIGPIKKNVLSRRYVCPVDWQVEDWRNALKRDSRVECTLAARRKTDQGGLAKRIIV